MLCATYGDYHGSRKELNLPRPERALRGAVRSPRHGHATRFRQRSVSGKFTLQPEPLSGRDKRKISSAYSSLNSENMLAPEADSGSGVRDKRKISENSFANTLYYSKLLLQKGMHACTHLQT